jgi:hypothetical protein
MQSYTGRRFWPMDPRVEDIDIFDIAHALSHVCRFGGHCSPFYSVAEHSVYVSKQVDAMIAAEGLLHDASEAYLADVPRPLKVQLPQYQFAEAEWERVIAQKFSLLHPRPSQVKQADEAMLAREAQVLLGDPPADWGIEAAPAAVVIVRLLPDEAEFVFLNRARDIGLLVGR